MNKIIFSSELELGKFLGSTDVIPDAYHAILETTLPFKLHTNRRSGIDVLAVKSCSHDYTTQFLKGELNLVPSENLQVDFIPTKVKSSVANNEADSIPAKDKSLFSINKAVVELFQQLSDDLQEEEKKHINTPLIITGLGLGGYVAILSAMRLHHAIDVQESDGSKNTKRPICITFGCPLVGDKAFKTVIDERPQWKYSFLNVVANKDPVATFFSSDPYKPFGTFLFCTESGGYTVFEDQDLILPVLNAMKLTNPDHLHMYDYRSVLSTFNRKVLYRGVPEVGELNLNLFKAGITMQLREVGVSDDMNDQIEKMEKQIKWSKSNKNAYEPTRKLNEMKISLTYMEWYMKTRKSKGGYYDSYKNDETIYEIMCQNEIVKHQRNLNLYWKKIVEDKDKMPQKEGANLRKRWLYGGTNYRRIIEPLDIVRYYHKEKKVNYIENRPNHYKLLERWADEDKNNTQNSSEKKKG
ncbi:putative carboxylesterase [Helianthus debilis subsp. tardiflorus]